MYSMIGAPLAMIHVALTRLLCCNPTRSCRTRRRPWPSQRRSGGGRRKAFSGSRRNWRWRTPGGRPRKDRLQPPTAEKRGARHADECGDAKRAACCGTTAVNTTTVLSGACTIAVTDPCHLDKAVFTTLDYGSRCLPPTSGLNSHSGGFRLYTSSRVASSRLGPLESCSSFALRAKICNHRMCAGRRKRRVSS